MIRTYSSSSCAGSIISIPPKGQDEINESIKEITVSIISSNQSDSELVTRKTASTLKSSHLRKKKSIHKKKPETPDTCHCIII